MVRIVEDLVEVATDQTQFEPLELVRKSFKVDLDAAAYIMSSIFNRYWQKLFCHLLANAALLQGWLYALGYPETLN